MCDEIRISLKWKKTDDNLFPLSVTTKMEKKSMIMDKKRILLPIKLVIF